MAGARIRNIGTTSDAGGTGPGADNHRCLYDHSSLAGILQRAGFHVRLLEWFDESGVFHASTWNPEDGQVLRSASFDPRNAGGELRYTSLIIDAVKPRDAVP